jgi:hypothetical protein
MLAAEHPENPAPKAILGPRRWLVVLGMALSVYVITAQRTVSWQDSGEFQWRCLTADLAGTMGLARAHPLYLAAGTLLARLTGPAMPLALNAFSGLGMAVALASFAAVASRLSRSALAGCLIAALLGVTHMVWWLSTIAEVYTWSLAALAIELYCLLRVLESPDWRWLARLAMVNGLHLCIHNFALLAWPVYLAVIVILLARRRLRPVTALPAVGAWLLGAGLYVGMTVQLAIETGSMVTAIRSALVGDYGQQVANVAGGSRHLKANLALASMNFLSPLLPLAVLGWWKLRAWPRRAAAPIVALTVIHVVFFVRYPVPDQVTFILPSLMFIALAASVGLGRLLQHSRKWRTAATALLLASVVLQPLVFVGAMRVAQRTGAAQRKRQLPFRDEARYWLLPWKQDETSAQQFAAAVFNQIEPGALIWPNSTSVYPLMTWQRLHKVRPDVSIQHHGHPIAESGALRHVIHERPVYIVSPTQSVGKQAQWVALPDGVLYRLIPASTDTSRQAAHPRSESRR